MVPLAFQGGTALRFLYALPRHSEYLEFELEGNPATYDLEGYVHAIGTEFHREGYDPELRFTDDRVVQNAWIRFRGLLDEMALSGHRDEVFRLKLEVDTRPSKGADLEITVVRRHVILHLHHHDRPSLLSGNIHAVLQRTCAKSAICTICCGT